MRLRACSTRTWCAYSSKLMPAMRVRQFGRVKVSPCRAFLTDRGLIRIHCGARGLSSFLVRPGVGCWHGHGRRCRGGPRDPLKLGTAALKAAFDAFVEIDGQPSVLCLVKN